MDLEVLTENARNYRSGIRAAARGLWLGVYDIDQFFQVMLSVIERGIPLAYYEGAKKCQVEPADLSPEERVEIRTFTMREVARIYDFAEFILANRKGTGLLRTVNQRADLWVARYADVVNAAQVRACKDKKLKWVHQLYWATKEPCGSCVKLDGKVKRASYWEREGVRPQNPPNPKLECKGWKCGCGFQPTDEPCTPGPLPELP